MPAALFGFVSVLCKDFWRALYRLCGALFRTFQSQHPTIPDVDFLMSTIFFVPGIPSIFKTRTSLGFNHYLVGLSLQASSM